MEKVRWTKVALQQLFAQTDYIRIDSLKNANNVEDDILTIAALLVKNPEKFSIDLQKINNDGSLRYFEKHSLRIAFQIRKDEVVILRCRHAKMKPSNY